jgi:hypothetical protein
MREHRVSEESVRAYCAMYGIVLSEEELRQLPHRLGAVFADLQALWRYDVADCEMAVVFPIDRWPR